MSTNQQNPEPIPSPLHFHFGEYSTTVNFYSTPQNLFDGVDLAVFDENTRPLVGNLACAELVLSSGESHKNWVSVEKILNAAMELGLARDSVILGFGGGVLCDMTAFAASLYMRGCQLVLAPTTLLSMVDAALGGKTGVDFQGYKNMVGTYYPAQELRIWPGALKTLSDREFLSGLAEVFKAALLDDEVLWQFLKNNKAGILARDPAKLQILTQASIAVKGRIVEADPKEKGIRAHLNLGHTFAHALETISQFSWTHGEAVVWGIDRALVLSRELGLASQDYLLEARGVFLDYGYKLGDPKQDSAALLGAMKKDKKKAAGHVRFVLQKGLGDSLLQKVEDEVVLRVLGGMS